MTTFYRDRAVYIGSTELHVDDRAYRLGDLEQVWHSRGRRGVAGVALILVRILLVLVVLGAIAGAGVAVRDMDMSTYDPGMKLAGAIVGVILLGTIGLFVVEGLITLIERSYERGGAQHQIWARFYGEDVLLFATRDKLKFGKVYRALQRAIEHSEDRV